jgi:hypothetical protein
MALPPETAPTVKPVKFTPGSCAVIACDGLPIE